ncbi:hypothetical protein IWW57_003530 [Coemansia sp. S610]|nr:hypothetical protein IWW57_003530 [Coemansia sp. S610]
MASLPSAPSLPVASNYAPLILAPTTVNGSITSASSIAHNGMDETTVSEAEPEPATQQLKQPPELYRPSLEAPEDNEGASMHWRHELAVVAGSLVEWLDALDCDLAALEPAQV